MMNNLPVGWINNDLRTVLEKIIDYRGQSVPKADTGVPLITARNVKKGYLDFSSKEYVDEALYSVWMSRGVPVSTDILFTTEAPLGNACRYPSGEKYAIGQRIVCLRAKKNILDSDYLLYFLLSDHGQTLIDIKSSGSTAKGIKSSELKKIKITYPESISEQIKIAEILSTWDNSINTVQKLLANSQQQKQSLMQQLLTGKKRFDGFEGEWEEKRLVRLS
jgi:type I restriction enzyme S subunit